MQVIFLRRNRLTVLHAFALAFALGACSANQVVAAITHAVASIHLSSKSGTLPAGSSMKLTAVTLDSQQVQVNAPVNWRSTNPSYATVDNAGMVTGMSRGVTNIIATSGTLADTAVLTITLTEPALTIGFEHEPSGMQLISDYGFSALNGSWTYQQKDATATIVADTSAPVDANVLQMNYPTGFPGGVSPAAEHPPSAIRDPNNAYNRKEMYLGFYWKANPEWQNHSSNINKLAFVWANNVDAFYICWQWWDGTSVGVQPKTLSVNHFAADNITSSVPGNFSLLPGKWYKIEWYMKLATTSTSNDGVTRAWVNGQLVLERTGVSRSGYFSDVYFDPTWGGVGGNKTRDDFFRYSHVRLSMR